MAKPTKDTSDKTTKKAEPAGSGKGKGAPAPAPAKPAGKGGKK